MVLHEDTMRRSTLIYLVLSTATLVYFIHTAWTLLTLLVVNGRTDAILAVELSVPRADDRTQLIPRILHQTYKDESIPARWQDAQGSCLALHQGPEWEYKLWTDDMAFDFIAKEYPWFLNTFKAYRYNIQRADAIRYFLLAHYGGVYVDLDDGCNRSLEPLLSFPAFARRTTPTGISNDVLGATPQHPFFLEVIRELGISDRSWILPYITIMASTGPLFLSVVWRQWSSAGKNSGDGADGGRIRLIFPNEYTGNDWSFFTHHVGNSWHSYDVRLIFWLARHWMLLTLLGLILGASLLFLLWWTCRRCGSADPGALPWNMGLVRYKPTLWRRTDGQRYEHLDRPQV